MLSICLLDLQECVIKTAPYCQTNSHFYTNPMEHCNLTGCYLTQLQWNSKFIWNRKKNVQKFNHSQDKDHCEQWMSQKISQNYQIRLLFLTDCKLSLFVSLSLFLSLVDTVLSEIHLTIRTTRQHTRKGQRPTSIHFELSYLLSLSFALPFWLRVYQFYARISLSPECHLLCVLFIETSVSLMCELIAIGLWFCIAKTFVHCLYSIFEIFDRISISKKRKKLENRCRILSTIQCNCKTRSKCVISFVRKSL